MHRTIGDSQIILFYSIAVNSMRSDGERRYARRCRTQTGAFPMVGAGLVRSVGGRGLVDTVEGVGGGDRELLLARSPWSAPRGRSRREAEVFEDVAGNLLVVYNRY